MTIKQTGFQRDTVGNYITKDPSAVLQYGVDWNEWLTSGDSLTDSTWTVETTGTRQLTATGPFILDNVALVTLTSGQPGEIYTVANTITTAEGWTDTRRFRVKVDNRYIK